MWSHATYNHALTFFDIWQSDGTCLLKVRYRILGIILLRGSDIEQSNILPEKTDVDDKTASHRSISTL